MNGLREKAVRVFEKTACKPVYEMVNGVNAVVDFVIAQLKTPKHETVEELRVVVEKHGECAKVSLKYGDKLLTSEDINSHNVLVSDMFLSHIRGTVCNLIVDVVNGKPEIKE